jgi:hypothetical protein
VGAIFYFLMQIFSSLLGLVLVLLGLVWMGQGLHIGPQELMEGPKLDNPQWAFWGALLILLGIAQVVWSNIRGR